MSGEQMAIICLITAGIIFSLIWCITEIRDINDKLNLILASMHDRINKLEKGND